MKIGIEFTLNDGSRDWYDPVDEEQFNAEQTEFHYVIDIGAHVYEIPKAYVKSIRKYELPERKK